MMRTAVLQVARACGLFALSRWLTRGQLRILCYHGIWNGPPPHYGDCLFMSPARFAARIDGLARRGYRVITLDEACRRLPRGELGARDIVITIDDAWAGIVPHMLPVLQRHGYAATLYVTTYYALAQKPVLNVLIGYLVERARRRPDAAQLPAGCAADMRPAALAARLAAHVDALPTLDARWAEVKRLAVAFDIDLAALTAQGAFMLMSPAQLREAAAQGVDLQLHTHTHRLHDFSAEPVGRELALNRAHLADIAGVAPGALRHFCYPSGEYDPVVFASLRAAGIVSATTTEFGLNPPQAEPLALKRILDCESMSDLDIEARLSGFWSLLGALRARVRGTPAPAAEHLG